jgi:hypothetical protein
MVAKARSKRGWTKEDKKRPSSRLDVKNGYVKDAINLLHKRIYLFIYLRTILVDLANFQI